MTGLYGLDIQATPQSGQLCAALTLYEDAESYQATVLAAVKGWWQQDQYNARANLNYVIGDFLGWNDDWPIVADAIAMNQSAQAPQLTLTTGNPLQENGEAPLTVTCVDPRGSQPPMIYVNGVTQGPQSPNRAPADNVQNTDILGLRLADFPGAGNDPSAALSLRCSHQETGPSILGWGEDSLIVARLSDFPPVTVTPPSDGVHLTITCLNPKADEPIKLVAYPAADGPSSPDAQTFSSPGAAPLLTATYSRSADYDVGLACSNNDGSIGTLTVPAYDFPPPGSMGPASGLTIGSQTDYHSLSCTLEPWPQPVTLSLAAQTPGAPQPLTITASGSTGSITLPVPPGYFPPGDYQLQATCTTTDGVGHQYSAAPLTFAWSQLPAGPTSTPTATLAPTLTPTPTAPPPSTPTAGPTPPPDPAHHVVVFAATGAEQTFTVPAGVTTVQVAAVGAPGGSSTPAPNSVQGGRGAAITGTLPGLTGGQILYVEVGGAPSGGGDCLGPACIGGWNGGGSADAGGGGGGASDVRTRPRAAADSLGSRLLVAAAGGGAGQPGSYVCDAAQQGTSGGDAGAAGGAGSCANADTSTGGGAGGQTAGGAGTSGGHAGSLGQGGGGSGGGGGGGGLFGGGGGADPNYVNPNVDPDNDTTAAGGGGGGPHSSPPAERSS